MNVRPTRKKIQLAENKTPIILVVEDEEDNLLYISHVLIFLKYNFITAREGRVAYDLADRYEIDLVLLDLVLPDMSGFALVSLFKHNKSTQNIPIIAISALIRKQERDRALEVGCDDYLNKPYFIDELDRKIRQFLPRSFFSKTFLKPNLRRSPLAI